MDEYESLYKKALNNYSNSEPWPDNDKWHDYTHDIIQSLVQQYLDRLNASNCQTLLNAGCGRTEYNTNAKTIYIDIVEEYIKSYENYIVGTVEQIPLENNTIDIVICVGSVLNYTDAQKTISEFGRILAPGGILILEFERSNSSEFLFTRNYAKTVFQNRYIYNNQIHFLWLYNEKYIAKLARFYGLKIIKRHRFHCLSTLMYRLGVAEEVAAKYCSSDKLLQPLSYPIAHNVILFFKKTITDEFS